MTDITDIKGEEVEVVESENEASEAWAAGKLSRPVMDDEVVETKEGDEEKSPQVIDLDEEEPEKPRDDIDRGHIVPVNNVNQAPDDKVVHCHDVIGLYYVVHFDDVPSSREEAMEMGWDPVAEVEQKAAEMNVRVFQIAAPDDGDYEEDVVAVGVELPNGDVYVDWNLEAFPDPLDNPHVSIYGSLDDLDRVADGEIQHLDEVSSGPLTEKFYRRFFGWDEDEEHQDVKSKARTFLDSGFHGNVDIDKPEDTIEYKPPFTKGEAGYMTPEHEGFDPDHKRCESCVFYVADGGCMMVQDGVDPDHYCTELYSDILITGHRHGGEDEEEVAEELTIWGQEYDWNEEDVNEFAESVVEILLNEIGRKAKAEYEPSAFGTDGDPSLDADDLYAFLDDLVDAGADVWQVRNGELRVWPDDKSDWAVHDPYYYVIGIEDEEAMSIYDDHPEVEFMHTPEVEKAGPRSLGKSKRFSDGQKVDLRVGDSEVSCIAAVSQAKRYTGLSEYETLKGDTGMMFVWPREQTQQLVFREMSFPIDVIFFNTQWKVVEIGELSEESQAVRGTAKYALELPHGWAEKHDIQLGDDVEQIFDEQSREMNKFAQNIRDNLNATPEELDVIENHLFEAYKEQVWPVDLTKAPTMWASDDEVPDFVERWIDEVIELMDPMWDQGFDDIPHAAAIKVHNEIANSLTQPQGWSTASIANRIQEEFDWLTQRDAEIIARQEVAAILNKAREVAYRARKDFDQMVFDWVGPDDAHTTEICTDIKEEIEDRGGAVTMDALKEILRDKAQEYIQRGGTPARVDQLVPHFQCRHTVVKRELEDLR